MKWEGIDCMICTHAHRVWCKRKEHQLRGHRPHCSEGCRGHPREWSVFAHSSGIYTPTVFISAHNGADLHLHGPECLQFSAVGEKRGVIEKALSKALAVLDASVAGRPFGESADRHRKYNFCLPFKDGREKVEKCLQQQTMRSSLQWAHVLWQLWSV